MATRPVDGGPPSTRGQEPGGSRTTTNADMQPESGTAWPVTVDRQLQAQDSDRVYEAAGNQYIYLRPASTRTPAAVMNTLPRDVATFTGRTDELGKLNAAVTQLDESGEV